MPSNTRNKPKNWREVALSLTALIPIYIASHVASLVPGVPAFPGWVNEIIDFAIWVPLCLLFITIWARLLYWAGFLDDDQLERYPFGIGVGRD